MGGRINRSSNETGKALGNTRVPYELEIYCNHAGSLFCCFVFALIALVEFFPGVLLDMPFEVGNLVA